jgi:hypothetical protein
MRIMALFLRLAIKAALALGGVIGIAAEAPAHERGSIIRGEQL